MTNTGLTGFPQTLPPGSVVGRRSSSAGPAEALTFQQLASQIGQSLSGTSATSNTIGSGNLTFTTQTNLGFVPGQFVSVVAASSPANYINGPVVSYSATTGVLVVDSLTATGSGTFTGWNIALSAPAGFVPPLSVLEGGTGVTTIAAVAVEVVAAVTTTAIQGLTTTAIQGLTSSQIAALTTTSFSGVQSTQLGAISTTAFEGLTSSQIAALTTTSFSGVQGTQLGAISTTAIQGLTSSQVAAIPTTAIKGLTTTQLSALTTTQLAGLSANMTLALSAANTPWSGLVNGIRNAGCSVAQRGTSGTATTSGAMTLDGMYLVPSGASVTWAQVANPFAKPRSPWALKITSAASVTGIVLRLPIESFDAAKYAGKIVTIQARVITSSGVSTFTPTLTTKYPSAADSWGSPTTDINAVNLQSVVASTETVLAYVGTVSGNATLGYTVNFSLGTLGASSSNSITIGEFSIQETPGATSGATTATPPEFVGIPYALDLAWCQRFLPVLVSSTSSYSGVGTVNTSTQAYWVWPFPATTRAAVTGITVSASNFQLVFSGTSVNVTGITFSNGGTQACNMSCAVSSGLTNGNSVAVGSNGTAATILFTGAEITAA